MRTAVIGSRRRPGRSPTVRRRHSRGRRRLSTSHWATRRPDAVALPAGSETMIRPDTVSASTSCARTHRDVDTATHTVGANGAVRVLQHDPTTAGRDVGLATAADLDPRARGDRSTAPTAFVRRRYVRSWCARRPTRRRRSTPSPRWSPRRPNPRAPRSSRDPTSRRPPDRFLRVPARSPSSDRRRWSSTIPP